MQDFKVKLISFTRIPQTVSTAGALGCFEEKSSAQLLRELGRMSAERRKEKEAAVLKNSFGRGHGSVGDQNYFIFSIENLPRAATLFLCCPEYLSHLQQSLRRAKASRGFHIPEAIKNSPYAQRTRDILLRSFSLYEEMCGAGIPAEDARYLLPLYTKTNIQTGGDARELCHLWQMSQQVGVPPVVKAVVEEMISLTKERAPALFEKFGHNFEQLAWYPAPQLYARENKLIQNLIMEHGERKDVTLVDSSFNLPISEEAIEKAVKDRDEAQLANLNHVHFEFFVYMSLACFHQAVRQRTWNHSVESIYDAVQDGMIVMPPSIKKSSFSSIYEKQHDEMIDLFQELTETVSFSEAIGVVPHSLKLFTLIHINGWNIIHSIGKRTCQEAQWEIRKIAWKMAKIIKKKFPALGKWAEPQCITYGVCPEVKNCGYDQKLKK